MIRTKYAGLLFAMLVPALYAAHARHPRSNQPAADSQPITLNVVVDSQSGQPVTNLTQSDFQLFDNKSPSKITSFKAVSGTQNPVSVILFLDAVNMDYDRSAKVRQGVNKFLMANGGKLPYPTTIAVFGDDGLHISPSSSNAVDLTATLADYQVSLRNLSRSTQYGRSALINLSLSAFGQILAYAQKLPGRKLIICVSPGWPILSGPGLFLSWQEQNQIFSNVVLFSTQLRKEGVTLYDINPEGVSGSQLWNVYYQSFLNGPAKPGKAAFGDLALPVLAVQSGGSVIETNRSIARYIQQCLMDGESWYEIGMDPAASGKPNQYHHLVLKLTRPGLNARTNVVYYSDPQYSAQPR